MGNKRKHPIIYYLFWFLLVSLCSGCIPADPLDSDSEAEDTAEDVNANCFDNKPFLSVADGGDGTRVG